MHCCFKTKKWCVCMHTVSLCVLRIKCNHDIRGLYCLKQVKQPSTLKLSFLCIRHAIIQIMFKKYTCNFFFYAYVQRKWGHSIKSCLSYHFSQRKQAFVMETFKTKYQLQGSYLATARYISWNAHKYRETDSYYITIMAPEHLIVKFRLLSIIF